MSEYIKKSDVRHLLLHNDRDAAVAQLDELEGTDPISLGPDNIKDIESLSFVDSKTHEVTEFVRLIHAEWIEKEIITTGFFQKVCSNCGFPQLYVKFSNEGIFFRCFDDANYCPNCGARMRGEDDE